MADDTKVDTYMPFFCGDFLTATMGWTAAERGHYIVLLSVQWTNGSIPEDLKSIERISPGVGRCWEKLEKKFPKSGFQTRHNPRLEEHRIKAVELKRKRAEAGKKGNKSKWGGSQCDDFAIANGIANGIAKTSPPSPSPSPSPSSSSEEISHTHTPPAGDLDEWRKPGWAMDAWTKFAAKWNTTERAAPWRHLTPPDRWLDLIATPGWIERAEEALAMLPSRRHFSTPLPVTQFFELLDRIRAGEFAEPKQARQAVGAGPRRGGL